MDKLEQTVERERTEQAVSQRQESDIPFDAGLDHPALANAREQMVKKYHRTMQQLDNQRRDLERQAQQFAGMQTMMQQQTQSAGSQQNGNQNADEFDWLDPEVKPLLNDPNAGALRALVRSFDKRTASGRSTENLSSLQQQVEALSQQIQQTQMSHTQERYARQIPDFRNKYGNLLDEDMQQNVLRHALNTGADLERALFATHPEVALAQERVRMEKELRGKLEAEYGAVLEGMEDIVSAQPQAKRSPIDSGTGKMVPFAQTAMDVLGKGGMVAALRDGFAREETVTEG